MACCEKRNLLVGYRDLSESIKEGYITMSDSCMEENLAFAVLSFLSR